MKNHYRPNHTFSSFKTHKNTQATLGQHTTRAQSFRLKPSKAPTVSPTDSRNPEIYFNSLKRKSYLKNVIDNYFSTPAPQSKVASALIPSPRESTRTIKRKDVHTSEGTKRRPTNSATHKTFQFNVGSIEAGEQLPIISEIGFIRRPISSQKSQRSAFFRKVQRQDSFFNESSRSIYDSKVFSQDLVEYENKSNRTTSSNQKSRKINVRVFAGDKDEQLIREKLISKLGYSVLWQPTQKPTIMLYPAVKTLQDICYSTIEDNKGQDPLILIYPKDYYFRLFANQCEELKDILRGMAKIIAKCKGIVACNQINMKNITKVEEKRFELCDWSCAAIQETLKVQDKVFNKFHIPYCKVEERWMVSPQYLAPELLRAIEVESFEHLWGQKGGISACDIWSLGCLLLQLITLVPLGQINHCAVKGGSHSKRGILGIKNPTADGLLQKHKYFRTLALRRLKDHIHQFKLAIPQRIVDLLPRMIESDPSQRVSVSELLQILQ